MAWIFAFTMLISVVLSDDITYGNLWVEYNITSVYGKIYGKGALPFTCSDDQIVKYDSVADNWVCEPGLGGYYLLDGSRPLEGNMDVNDYVLTDVGELIMNGIITSRDVFPFTDDLYSLGNSTNWWAEAYVKKIFSEDIQAQRINASELNSSGINSEDINSDRLETENLTVGDYEIIKEAEDLTLILT